MWGLFPVQAPQQEHRINPVNSPRRLLVDTVAALAISIFSIQVAKNFERELSPGFGTLFQCIPIVATLVWILRRFSGFTNFNFRQYFPAVNRANNRNPVEVHHHHHQGQGVGNVLYRVPDRRPDNGIPRDYVPPVHNHSQIPVRPFYPTRQDAVNLPQEGVQSPNRLFQVPNRRPSTNISSPRGSQRSNSPPRATSIPNPNLNGDVLHPVPNRRPGGAGEATHIPLQEGNNRSQTENNDNPLHAVPNRRPPKQ